MTCGPPGSPTQGILQASILEWVTISSSRGSSQPRDQTQVSCTAGGLFTTGPPGKPSSLHRKGQAPASSFRTVTRIPQWNRTTAECSQNPTPSFFSDHFLIMVTAFSAGCSWVPDIKHSIWCLTSWWLLRLHPELKLNTEVNACLLFCGADPTHTWNSFCQLSAMPKHHYIKGHLILGSELAVMDGPWLCFL